MRTKHHIDKTYFLSHHLPFGDNAEGDRGASMIAYILVSVALANTPASATTAVQTPAGPAAPVPDCDSIVKVPRKGYTGQCLHNGHITWFTDAPKPSTVFYFLEQQQDALNKCMGDYFTGNVYEANVHMTAYPTPQTLHYLLTWPANVGKGPFYQDFTASNQALTGKSDWKTFVDGYHDESRYSLEDCLFDKLGYLPLPTNGAKTSYDMIWYYKYEPFNAMAPDLPVIPNDPPRIPQVRTAEPEINAGH